MSMRDGTKLYTALLAESVKACPIAMIVIDQNGLIVLVNRESEKLFGYTNQEFQGQPIEMLIPERFRPKHPDRRDSFFANPKTQRLGQGRDLFGRRKDGSEFPAELGLSLIKTYREPFALGTVVDITKRKQVEQRLLESIECAPTAMIMVNREGSIVLVNRESETMFGYTRDELRGQSIKMLIPERFYSQHLGLRKRFFANPRTEHLGRNGDIFVRHQDGHEFPIELGLGSIKTDQGLFALGTIIDITERRRLEQQVVDRTEELTRRNEDLQQFAYVASHDLQEPLRKVASCCQALFEDYADKLDKDGLEWITFAVDGAVRMRQQVNDLLDFSRVDTRNEAAEPVNAYQACEAALDRLAMTIEERDVQIICRPLPAVLADRPQLEQLFQNLIGNGIKYCTEEQPVIEIGAEPDGSQWTFYVKDNGIGIAPEFHERIFQIFQRLHRRDEYAGTGIGLAICRKIVERSGGKLWIESEDGQGSTFYFTLPAIDSQGAKNHAIGHTNKNRSIIPSACDSAG